MSKICVNCANYPKCPILREADKEDILFDDYIVKCGRRCIDFVEK